MQRKFVTFNSVTVLCLAALAATHCSAPEPRGSEVKIIDASLVDMDVFAAGSMSFQSQEYRVGDAVIDPWVTAAVATDVRGKLYLPDGAGPFPLLVFLHGNHPTCGTVGADGMRSDDSAEWTLTGQCPDGKVEAPSHDGYAYIATHLAAHGYAIATINANRGINAFADERFIDERGKLVLKHLSVLEQWNKGDAPPANLAMDIKGKLDFRHVGFMGHSRGGEGVRAAYQMYKERRSDTYASLLGELEIEAIFELAPVDGFANVSYDVPGANWTVVIGTCDGDVEDYQGVNTFRRRRQMAGSEHFSSVIAIPGANHNAFNSEWHTPDTTCDRGQGAISDDIQRQVSLALHAAFFRGFVGPRKDASLAKVFDPEYALPKKISALTPLARESVAARTAVTVREEGHVDELVTVKGSNRNQRDLVQISWRALGGSYVSKMALAPTSGEDILSLSVAAQDDMTCDRGENCGALNFSISLVYADGSESNKVALSDYAQVIRLPGRSVPESVPCLGEFANGGDWRWCLVPELTTSDACLASEPAVNMSFIEGKCYRYAGILSRDRQLLFAEVPVELKDFGFDPRKTVAGFKLTFDRAPVGGFYLDRKVLLRKK